MRLYYDSLYFRVCLDIFGTNGLKGAKGQKVEQVAAGRATSTGFRNIGFE